jgi:hypothetical protein
MPSNLRKNVSDLRQQVNAYFLLSFNNRLIRENEKGVADLEDNCPTKEFFVCQIANLANLIEDFDNDALRSLIKSETKGLKSIKLLEKILDEKNIDKRSIITSLQRLRRIRDTVYPVHRGTSKEFIQLMRERDFKPPYDWNAIWRDCIGTYRNSLAELVDALHDYTYEIQVRKNCRETSSKIRGSKQCCLLE